MVFLEQLSNYQLYNKDIAAWSQSDNL